jgi:hypothetical protein
MQALARVPIATGGSSLDRDMMQSLLVLSSCESARAAAAAWLGAFDAARAHGATEQEAENRAAEVWRRAYG